MTPPPSDDTETDTHAPAGVFEGVWSLDAPLDTPDIMRDCIRERYWGKPGRAEYFKAARRLADDLKRRGCPQKKALELILGHLTTKLNLIRREQLKNIEKAVTWVYEKQDHGLTCSNTGALSREGICHLSQRRCIFSERDQEIKTSRRTNVSVSLPPEVAEELKSAHPSAAIYATWTYEVVAEIEAERGLAPGDESQPIFVGYRTMVDRVKSKQRSPGYTRYTAVESMHLLIDVGAIKKVIEGKSGTMRRQANGYIRLPPQPPSAPPVAVQKPDSQPAKRARKIRARGKTVQAGAVAQACSPEPLAMQSPDAPILTPAPTSRK